MFQKIVGYIKNSKVELKKVIWPTRKQIINQTVLVIVVSLIVAMILGVVDYFLTRIIALIIH